MRNVKLYEREQILSEDMGGELGEMIKRLTGQNFTCCSPRSNPITTIDFLVGYPNHSDGLADANGKKWWVYYKCEKCHYDTSWQAIEVCLRNRNPSYQSN